MSHIDGTLIVGVQAGEFIISKNDCYIDQQPAHTVFLDAFDIDKFEATNDLYKQCIQARSCIQLNKPGYFHAPDNTTHGGKRDD